MKKMTINQKTLKAGSKKANFFGKGFNLTAFMVGLGFNMVSNIISNATSMVAMDTYNENPNPKYSANDYQWTGSSFRFGPNAYRSSYNIIGGW